MKNKKWNKEYNGKNKESRTCHGSGWEDSPWKVPERVINLEEDINLNPLFAKVTATVISSACSVKCSIVCACTDVWGWGYLSPLLLAQWLGIILTTFSDTTSTRLSMGGKASQSSVCVGVDSAQAPTAMVQYMKSWRYCAWLRQKQQQVEVG